MPRNSSLLLATKSPKDKKAQIASLNKELKAIESDLKLIVKTREMDEKRAAILIKEKIKIESKLTALMHPKPESAET